MKERKVHGNREGGIGVEGLINEDDTERKIKELDFVRTFLSNTQIEG